MTDREVQRKLNQMVRLANELSQEAVLRYGSGGSLFYESEGSLYLMDGDEDGGAAKRQSHIRFTSIGYCRMGAGAW